MDNQKAIEWLKAISAAQIGSIHKNSLSERKEALHMGIKALEKQINKNPIIKGVLKDWYVCPCCGDELCKKYDYDKRYANCHWCGQALDWDE